MLEWVLLIVVVAFLLHQANKKSNDAPPTPPIRLPILGHAHYLFMYSGTKTTTQLYELFRRFNKNGVLSLEIGTMQITLIGKWSMLARCMGVSLARGFYAGRARQRRRMGNKRTIVYLFVHLKLHLRHL
jgi:hypothetical protein